MGLNLHLTLKGLAVPTLLHRLRSVKMEQRKLSDQANTLVDLSKVSGRIQRHPGVPRHWH
jgi:hypothetical protein